MFWKAAIFKTWKFYISFISFFLLFYFGWCISQYSWDGNVFLYLDNIEPSSTVNARHIASVEKKMEILKEGRMDSQNTLVQSSQINNQEDIIQFYLGHFLVKSAGGGSVLACQKYQTVDMTFIAAGVSFHGHVPKMVLKASCRFNLKQPLQMGPFIVPKRKIIQSPLNRQLFKEDNDTLLFTDVHIEWPEKWVLSQVRFISDEKEKDFTVVFTSNKEEDFFTLHLK